MRSRPRPPAPGPRAHRDEQALAGIAAQKQRRRKQQRGCQEQQAGHHGAWSVPLGVAPGGIVPVYWTGMTGPCAATVTLAPTGNALSPCTRASSSCV
jgi:hypothetical protein